MRYWFAAVAIAGMVAGSAGEIRAQMPDDLKIGYQAYRSGQFQEAVDAFGRAIEFGQLDRDALAVTLNNRGVAYSQLGDYDAAIRDYLQAQQIKADDPTTIRNLRFAYLTRGLASANQGHRDAALQDYDRALGIDPTYLEALQYRGALRVEMGAHAEATVDFRRVLALDPENPTALAALAALDSRPADTPPAPHATAPAVTGGTPAGDTGSDPVQDAVARSQTAQERAQAALDEALAAARQVEPTAVPETAVPVSPATETAVPVSPATETARDEVAPAAPATKAEDAPSSEAAEEKPEAEPTKAADSAAIQDVASAPRPDAPGMSARFRVTTSVNLRAGPGNAFNVIGTLAPDLIVTPDDEELGWYRIPRDGEPTGWVYRRFLDPVQ